MASEAPQSPADIARAIDAHFDEMLYDGMPDDLMFWVEQQRQHAHDDLMNKLLQPAGHRRV